MNIKFSKYQGTGNDFIIINNISNFFPKNDNKLIIELCDRKLGIGADNQLFIFLCFYLLTIWYTVFCSDYVQHLF